MFRLETRASGTTVSSEIEWRWADPRGQQRLVRTDELRAALANGVIAPNAPVWRRGWTEWKPAHEVPELQTSAAAGANGVVLNVPPPPLFVVAAQTQFEGPPVVRTQVEQPPPPPAYVPTATGSSPAVAASSSARVAPNRNAISKKTIMGVAPAAAGSHGPPSSGADQLRRAVANVAIPPPASSIPQSMRATVLHDSGEHEVNTVVDMNPLAHDPEVSPDSTRPERRSSGLGALTRGASPNSSLKSPSARAASAAPAANNHTSSKAKGGVSTVIGVPSIDEPRTIVQGMMTDVRTGGMAEAIAKLNTVTSKPAQRQSTPPPAPSVRAKPTASATPPPVRRTSKPPPPPAASARTSKPPPPITKSKPPPPVNPLTPLARDKTPPPPASSAAVAGGKVKPKRTTLILHGGAPSEGEEAPPSREANAAPPIVVPGPGAPAGKNAVTRPPPWGEGAVEIGAQIPRSAPAGFDEVEVSGSMLMEDEIEPPNGQHFPAPGPSIPISVASSPMAADSGRLPPATEPPPGFGIPDRGLAGKLPVRSPLGSRLGETVDTAPPAPYPWMQSMFTRFPSMHKVQVGKPRFFFPVLGAVVLLFVVTLTAFITKTLTASDEEIDLKALSKKADTPAHESSASASAEKGAPSTGKTLAAADKAGGAVMPTGPCALAGAPKSVAAHVLVPSGVEVARAAQGIALGFATGPKEGVVMVVDPKTLGVVSQTKVKAADTIKRVMPITGEKGVNAAADIDRKSDSLVGRRTAAGGSPIDFGVADGQLAGAPHNSDKSTGLWPMPGDGPVEALRAVPLDTAERGYAITFRRNGAIWLGAINSSATVKGNLTSTPGLGAQVGSPAIASSGDMVLVAWADRAGASDPWGLRWQRWRQGEPPEATKSVEAPSGGLGSQYMSPGIAGLGGGRFLLVWTEGPVSSHQVRAQTIDSRGRTEGAALTISTEDANAGQGQAAVMADGRGLVAYIVANAGGGFELMATPVSCPPP